MGDRRLHAALTLPIVTLLGVLATGCSSEGPATSSDTVTAGAAPGTASATASSAANTPIQIRIGDTVIKGSLNDTAPARALLSRLPLTLDFGDLNGEEKIGHLDQELPMTRMPAGDDPIPGDIGYYAPWGNVVFYYGDVSRYDGIARIGTLEQTTPIQRHDGDFSATIQRAN
ncbi:cyclophilin-like fold protein [Curtobacterium sp. MCBD17_032]|uniref:cyclophilin-like fold protein n=1 Tax=Curtobacterium sp. MCBD17_032 TaxID=2175659 RepID=UPI000DA72700|nr:cyclophilin-like fold protein [Curtobacterium sp. MCBD17_032]PZE84385.1 hypothetical protein DEI91_08700 [Curtobacterium sp. MCBD17_032]